MQQSRKLIRKFTTSNEKSLKASYLVSLRIAKTAQPHTIAERSILPAAKDLVENLIAEAQARKLDKVPVSNNTVCRRIQDMADYSKSHLVRRVAESPFFAIQLDKSTDVTNFPQLLVNVRFVYDFETIEDFLFCKPLEGRTTSVEIFKVLNDFVDQNGISWEKCVWGLFRRCSRDDRETRWCSYANTICCSKFSLKHCRIHTEALAAKTLQSSFKDVLDNAIKVVNLIIARALNSRMFTIMRNDMGAEHDKLLLHTEVRWLSRGKVLFRLFELRAEVRLFLIDINSPFQILFCDDVWQSKLAYLADVFRFLNQLNLSLQGATVDIHVFQVSDKINSTVRKLQLRLGDIEKNNLAAFPLLCEFISENDLHIDSQLKLDIAQHCQQLIEKFHLYFPKNYEEFGWIRFPFSTTVDLPDDFSTHEKDFFSDLSCGGRLKNKFEASILSSFWLHCQSDFPKISTRATKFLLPFCTSYLCERGFSAMLAIKSKYRSRLELEPNLRLNLTKIHINIDELVAQKQAHPSH